MTKDHSEFPRPALSIKAPYTFHGMGSSERSSARAELESALRTLVGDLEIMDLLMCFHEDAQGVPGWSRLRLDFDEHGIATAYLLFGDPEDNTWLGVEPASASCEGLIDLARDEGIEMSPKDAQRLVDAAYHLALVTDKGFKSLDEFGCLLHEDGLTREQVASPGRFLFPSKESLIESWESAQKLSGALASPTPRASPKIRV